MYYYAINGQIFSFIKPLDREFYSQDTAVILSQEQIDFYELHKCSTDEVLDLKLRERYVPLLEDLKIQRIEFYSQLAFDTREQELPSYKIMNAGLGIYSNEETLRITNIINRYREEFYRLKTLVENVNTIEELNNIEAKY